jgi:exodeoxyribonuclease VII small subunit
MTKKTPATSTENALAPSYEAALQELEALIQRMEEGDLSLEASIQAFQRGTTLIKFCEAQLADAEEQIKLLDNPPPSPE